MARNDSRAENHHYVPKMLLRNFVPNEAKEQLFVFDKKLEKSFPSNVKNIATERNFYDLSSPNGGGDLEASLSEMEHKTAQAFEKLLKERDLKVLTESDRSWIGVFIASQHVRVKNFREVIKDLNGKMVEKIRGMGGAPEDVEGFQSIQTDDQIKEFSIYFLLKSLPEFSSLMLNKLWILFSTDENDPFWISDNPVTLHNDLEFGPYGNIGLGVRGIQIHLPLSTTLMLALWCPSYADQFIGAYDRALENKKRLEAQRVLGVSPYLNSIDRELSALSGPLTRLAPLVVPMKEGVPSRASAENVLFYNSLQAKWAERFVMSPKNDFQMVRRMLKEFPHTKRGMRATLD
ncbi:DUF4238 domain-containing protein [Ferrovibrio terrae]|uniref:DUF4238 domain-containing protein n=1 Tax=Ferrovibrio terrae TaxID=2594003 RepID=UPI003137745C